MCINYCGTRSVNKNYFMNFRSNNLIEYNEKNSNIISEISENKQKKEGLNTYLSELIEKSNLK